MFEKQRMQKLLKAINCLLMIEEIRSLGCTTLVR